MDGWDPEQYQRFAAERARPFHDLIALVRARPGMRVADLGCGPGNMTRVLHEALSARETLGVDSSAAMLAEAAVQAGPAGQAGQGLRFEQGDLRSFAPAEPFDLVFSNAALHWAPDHPGVLRTWAAALAPGGQLAVQMPDNDSHVSHQAAFELAREPLFRRALEGWERRPVLPAEAYASILHGLGFREQQVRLQIYPHLLPSRDSVIEWVKGALLTDYRARLPPELYARFLARYRAALLPQLGQDEPFLYTYRRLLIWGQL